MKKALSIALMIVATAASAAVQTNWVYVVSNIYIRTSEVRYVTNRVQNTHYNYYFTNNVTTVSNIWTVNYTTNFHYDVVNTNFGPWIVAASNQANRAAEGAVAATNMANVAAGHATTAGSYSSSAQASASQAQAYRNQTQTAADAGLSNINARIAWFDAHSGETITMVNVTTNIDMYIDPSLSFPYTSTGGTAYNNIRYYPLENANGKVAITSVGSYKPTGQFCLWPGRGNSNDIRDRWYFEPAYVDSDAYGLRLHYIATEKKILSGTSGTSYDGIHIPRDFYWQNGVIYATVDRYNTSSNWIGRIVISISMTGNYTFPNSYRGTSSDTDTINYLTMSHYSHEGNIFAWSSSTEPLETRHGRLKTAYGKELPSNSSTLWFPAQISESQRAVADWIEAWPYH